MAAGDITAFYQFKVDLGNKIHDLDGDTWKFALITSTLAPTAADAAPHWGGTGTSDLSTNQVTPGGNYSTGGVTLTTMAFTNSSGTVSWKADKVSIAQHASNPTNARYGVIYNSTDTNKRAAVWIDLGSAINLTTGPFEFRFAGVDGNGTILTLA